MSTSSETSTIAANLSNNHNISKTYTHGYDGDGNDQNGIGELKDNLRKISSYSDDEESYESDTNNETTNEKNTEIQLIMDSFAKNKNVTYYNKTFSTNKIREIERSNTILMNKICSNNVRRNQYPVVNTPQIRVTSNSINKRRRQQEIDHNNLLLLKRIQSIKPFGLSRRKP